MDLFDIAVARKLAGGGGGGGGDSDFSTATMTVVGDEVSISASACFDLSNVPEAPVPGYLHPGYTSYAEGAYQIALFKGYAMCEIGASNATVSGNAQFVGGNMYLVSGDFTVTH